MTWQSIHTTASGRRQSVPLFHGGSSKLRQGVLQLMIHSIDPMHSHQSGEGDQESGPQSRSRRRSSGQSNRSSGHNHRSSLGDGAAGKSRPGTTGSKKDSAAVKEEEDGKEEENGGKKSSDNYPEKEKRTEKDAADDEEDEDVPGLMSNGNAGGRTGAVAEEQESNNNPKVGEPRTTTVRMPQVRTSFYIPYLLLSSAFLALTVLCFLCHALNPLVRVIKLIHKLLFFLSSPQSYLHLHFLEWEWFWSVSFPECYSSCTVVTDQKERKRERNGRRKEITR